MDNIFRLAILIIEMNKDFSETVHKKGFTRAFGGVRPIANTLSHNTPSPNQSPNYDTGHSSLEPSTPETESPDYPELTGIITQTEAVPEPAKDDIME
jgi:hypothetical protein